MPSKNLSAKGKTPVKKPVVKKTTTKQQQAAEARTGVTDTAAEPRLMGPLVPEPKPTVDYDKGKPEKEACINCSFYAAGPSVFRGPHCTNPESPQYMVRMPEFGTCDEWTSKTKEQRANQVRTVEQSGGAVIPPPIAGEEAIARAEQAAGLYDPDAKDRDTVQHKVFDE